MKKSNTFITPFISLCLSVLIGCVPTDKDSDESANSVENIKSSTISALDASVVVETVIPTLNSFSKELKVVGSVSPLRSVDILPLESGQVKSVLVDVGDYVEKGQLLVILNNPIISRDIDALRVEAAAAERTLDRLKSAIIKSPGLIAATELDEADAASARASAALAAGEERLKFLKVLAPFDGVVSARNVHVGALVENGLTAPEALPMLGLVSCKEIRIILPYPERDMRFISVDSEIDLHFPDLDRSIKTKISRVAASVDASSRSVDVFVDITSENCDIKPGIYVEGSLMGGTNEAVKSLPTNVRFVKDGLSFALAVVDGVVKSVPINVYAENKEFIAFTAEITDANTEFILTGRNIVSVGQTVQTVLAK